MDQSFFEWLQNTPLAVLVGEVWFPWVESAHVLFLAAAVGSILIVDARLLGLGLKQLRITQIAKQLLPLTWIAFAGAAVTGLMLFMANATGYVRNTPFLIKMCLLLALGLNMLYFHVITYRSVGKWDVGKPALAVRTAGVISTVLWLAVICFGRWIGFV